VSYALPHPANSVVGNREFRSEMQDIVVRLNTFGTDLERVEFTMEDQVQFIAVCYITILYLTASRFALTAFALLPSTGIGSIAAHRAVCGLHAVI